MSELSVESMGYIDAVDANSDMKDYDPRANNEQTFSCQGCEHCPVCRFANQIPAIPDVEFPFFVTLRCQFFKDVEEYTNPVVDSGEEVVG